jgi:hypothetical protein
VSTSIHRAGVAWDGGEGDDVRAKEVLLGAIEMLHHCAPELCFIAKSVDFPVGVEPQ